MPYPYPLRIQGLLAEVETTPGVDPTPTAADNGVRGVGYIWPAFQSDWAFPNDQEDAVSNSIIPGPRGRPRGRIMNIDYTVQLRGAGVAYSSGTPVRPEIDPLLVSCGLDRVHDDSGGSETVTYPLVSTGYGSSTIWAYAGGKRFRVNYCRGNLTWSIPPGTLGQMRFQLLGLMPNKPDEQAVPSISYDTPNPPAAVALGLAIAPTGFSSWTPRGTGIEIVTGHEWDRFDDPNAANGIEGWFTGLSKPMFRFTPRAEDLSDYDPYQHAEVDDGTTGRPTLHTIDLQLGSVQYNQIALDVNAAQLTGDPQPAEDGRFAAWQLEYFCHDMAFVFS